MINPRGPARTLSNRVGLVLCQIAGRLHQRRLKPELQQSPAMRTHETSFEKSKKRLVGNFDNASEHRYTGRGIDYDLVRNELGQTTRQRWRQHEKPPRFDSAASPTDCFAVAVLVIPSVGTDMGASDGDQRPPLAVAAELAYQVTSVAMLMALPAGAGYWGDLKLGTSPCLVIVGAVAGLGIGILQLLRFVGGVKGKSKNRPDQNDR
jgi:hypothetical protein